jgi:hypothetical protein
MLYVLISSVVSVIHRFILLYAALNIEEKTCRHIMGSKCTFGYSYMYILAFFLLHEGLRFSGKALWETEY